jgi:hypothetical protein
MQRRLLFNQLDVCWLLLLLQHLLGSFAQRELVPLLSAEADA